jgi:rsbT co-antagonist protein RsbR
MATLDSSIGGLVKKRTAELKSAWLKSISESAATGGAGRISVGELNNQVNEFIDLFVPALQTGTDVDSAPYKSLRDQLGSIARSRALQGFSSSDTATFVFSLKKPLFDAVGAEFGKDPTTFARHVWTLTEVVDSLGLHAVKAFQLTREDVIRRQQEEMLELSTPVVKLWDGILALPMIGTLDSARTQVVMESLLNRIVETGSDMAIIDITGVPTVDTLVAQHLLKTVTALRLMGADCIISGVRPQIAQTIVHLGVDLQGVTTKANLADALSLALKRTGYVVSRATV